MWRRRGSFGGGTRNSDVSAAAEMAALGQSHSLTGYPTTSRNSFFGSDPRATDRAIVFTVEVPSSGPLGLDLHARHVERDKPQRGAVVKGFRPVAGGRRGFVETTGRVRIGDILQIIHQTYIDDMPFDQIVRHAMDLQQDPEAWPLRLEFRREQVDPPVMEDPPSRRSSFFRSSLTGGNAPEGTTFNEKLQYFRGFFANKIATGGAAPRAKEKPPMPSTASVEEMYRDLLFKRGVPDDVMDELIRIEPLENKWHIAWHAQENEKKDDTGAASHAAEAARFAEKLVELKWDNRGLKDLQALRQKISSGTAEWIDAFIERFGLDYLTMKLPDPSPFPVEHAKYDRATMICDSILRILRSLTHFTAGVESLTTVPGLIKRVALCFHTENGDLRKHTLQLLGIVCYNSAAGHQAVIEAFEHYKETKGENIRFTCLRDALKSTRYSLAFKEDVLSFVNIIVNKAIRLEDRLAIRADFIALKMAGYFEEIRAKSQAVQRQKLQATSGDGLMSITDMDGDSDTEGDPASTSLPPSPILIPDVQKQVSNGEINKTTDNPGTTSTRRRRSRLGSAGHEDQSGKSDLSSQLEAKFQRGSITREGNDRVERKMSRSAPSSPRTRSFSSEFDRLSTLSSRPSITEDPSVLFGGARRNSGNTIITSSVTQLRNQLDNMEKQIEVFERFMEDDRKDTIYQQTDLSSVDSVFESLLDCISNDAELQACFLSILQQLLFIPGDRAVGKEMWALCERLMKEVGLLAPVEEVRNYELGYDDRKTILRLRDKYTAFLQKCADEDPTFHFRVGPIILIENRKSDDDQSTADEDDDYTDDDDAEVKAQDHPALAKYFKLLRMGMPLQHVTLKMSTDPEAIAFGESILESPDKVISLNPQKEKKGIRADEHEKYAKFFKLKKMGMPLPHIQLKMTADGLDGKILETPEMLLDEEGNEIVEGGNSDGENGGIPARDHEKFAKYFKLLKMGMPVEHVKLKVSADGLDPEILDNPDTMLNEVGERFVAGGTSEGPAGIPVREHEKFAKFFKLLKMGMPLEHVKMKASAENLDADLLDTPDALLNEDGTKYDAKAAAPVVEGVPAREHEKYAKFFKLLKMGMPMEHVKMKVSSEGLVADMLDTPDKLLDVDGKEAVASVETEPSGVPAKEHEKFAKFFKLLKMGMPIDHVKLKVSAEGLDPSILETPDKLLDEEGKPASASTPTGTPVKEHEKFTKFFKLLKMGMPLDHVKLKASAEGLDGALLETPDALVDAEGKPVSASAPADVKVSDHPAYAKYFKLIKMGMPRPHLEMKMSAEGLNVALLDTPDALIPVEGAATEAAPRKPALPPPPPKPKLRNLYWEAVKDDSTAGTIWEEFDAEKPQGDAKESVVAAAQATDASRRDDGDRVLDAYVDKLAQVFVNKPPKAKESSETKKTPKRRAPTRVALIDVKRANNIGIMLARFRVPYPKICRAVLQVDKEVLSSEKVSALIQFAPEAEELEAVRNYTGDPKLLGDAEQYFLEMLPVPRLATRLQAIHATWQFDTYVEEQNKLMASVRDACYELRQCARLREIFKVVLSLGNALNDGTARGGARGFRISILLKLNQVKATDNSMTLLNYVAKLLREKDPAIISFDEELPSIESASRVTTQVLKAGETAVRKAAALICDELDAHAKLCPPKLAPPLAKEQNKGPNATVAAETSKVTATKAGDSAVANTPTDKTLGAPGAQDVSRSTSSEVKGTDKAIVTSKAAGASANTTADAKTKSVVVADVKTAKSGESVPANTAEVKKATDAKTSASVPGASSDTTTTAGGAPPSTPTKNEQPADLFQDAIRPFAERAKETSTRIQTELDEMMQNYEDTVSFYGEDPTSPENGPDSFFSIFYSFAKLLQTADRDNERKRITEERRIRREAETKKRLDTLKNKKKNATSFASLKDGDVDDIVLKIRTKRMADKRKELLATPFEAESPASSSAGERMRSPPSSFRSASSKSLTSSWRAGSSTHGNENGSSSSAKANGRAASKEEPITPAVEVV